METGYRLVGKWKGIPVFFHWTVLLWFPWFVFNFRSLSASLMASVAMIALLFAHEAGHAYAARARRLEVVAIRLFLMHGRCAYQAPEYEKDDIFVAWSGVLAQLGVLVVAGSMALAMAQWLPQAYLWCEPLLFVLIKVNLFMAIFNLLPIAPLDGHLAWRGAAPLAKRWSVKSRARLARLGNAINFKKRRALAVESRETAAGLLDRLQRGANTEVACHRASWRELYRFYLNGAVWVVNPELELAELALKFSAYGSTDLDEWLAAGHACRVSDEQALAWQRTNPELLAVVVEPHVLVKPT